MRLYFKEEMEINPKPKKIVGGVLIKCTKTNRVFLLLRNDRQPTWALVSGGIVVGENVLEGLKRELYEECFVKSDKIKFNFIGTEQIPEKNMVFHYYQGFTETEFKPVLDHENLNASWFSLDKLPSPLYKGLKEKILNILK